MKELKFRVYDKQSNEMIYLERPSTYDNGLWFKSDKHIDSNDIVIEKQKQSKNDQEIKKG